MTEFQLKVVFPRSYNCLSQSDERKTFRDFCISKLDVQNPGVPIFVCFESMGEWRKRKGLRNKKREQRKKQIESGQRDRKMDRDRKIER